MLKEIRFKLIELARVRTTWSYSQLNDQLQLGLKFTKNGPDNRLIGEWLGEISTHEHQRGRPLLSSLITHKYGLREQGAETKKKGKQKSKLTWEKVSTQPASNWIRARYNGFHFTSEMLIRFLMEEHITIPNYYSSEELKRNPQANETDDLKSLIFSAVSKQNTF